MTNSHDAEIDTVASKLVATIDKQAKIMQQLSAASRAIQDYFDNPGMKTIEGLKGLVSKAGAAASLTADTSDRIRHLSYQLRTLLDQEEAGNAEK